MKTWLKKSAWRKSAALLALPVALLLVIIGGALNANPASAQTTPGSAAGDRAILVSVYNSTGGDNWTWNNNWNTNLPLDHWLGVYTNSDGRVVRLDMSNNNVSGPIPAQLGELSLLTELKLYRNELTGQIPSEWANLENLELLYLSRNQLDGEIPAFLGDLTSLERLHLNNNNFTGAVPAELGNLTNMESLLLHSNPGLEGKMSPALTGMTSLERFHFQDTGVCYLNATNLERWIQGLNDAKGNDCDRAALIALYHATDGDNWHNNTNWLSDKPLGQWHGIRTLGTRPMNMFLQNNNLSGPLPPEFGDLNGLTLVEIHGNNLSGSFSPEWTGFKMPVMFFNDNNLSGRLPSVLFDKFDPRPNYVSYSNERFKDLDLRNNSGMYGPLPRSLVLARPIFSVLFTGTDLCAPGDADFQTELNMLPGIIGAPGTELTNLVTLDQTCTDRQILSALYEDTDGPNWTNSANWNSEQPLGEWHGVTTNADGRVTGLNLAENNLTGPLPDYLASLTELTELALQKNNLSGEISPALGQFEHLENFYLSRNNLTGEIPAEFGGLVSVSRLHLNNNSLSGDVPAELGNLTNLTSLMLQSNTGLSGELPQGLTKRADLWRIHFQDTGICAPLNAGFQQWLGNVSDAIGGNCANRDREALVALYNATDGANWTHNTNWLSERPIGEWDGVVTDANGNVKTLLLGNNNLRGSIPAEIGDFANLKGLALYTNWLSGSIPAELGNLTSLTRMNLSFNILVGEVPTELGNLTNLTDLGLKKNGLTGELPQSLTALTELNVFTYRSRDSVHVPCAPYDYAFMQWLEGLDSYEGGVCEPASDRDVLTMLYHSTNGDGWTSDARVNWLSDKPIGEWNGIATNADGRIWSINLDEDNLSGTIPAGLSYLSELSSLYLGDNSLTGEIPAELGSLSKLERLHLNDNQLTGEIPPELSNLPKIITLNLRDNDLSGPFPSDLGQNSSGPLWVLAVQNNSGLTGVLPRSLTALDFGEFHFGGTGLCAPGDEEFQTWLNGLYGIGANFVTLDQNCTDRQILTALYEDTGGANWVHTANWLSERPVNDWYGVHGNTEDRVTRLDLGGNNLSGELPAYVASLTETTGLWFHNNGSLKGPLPQSLTGLTNMTTLRFQSSGLCAPLDTDFQTWLGTVAETQGSNCAE